MITFFLPWPDKNVGQNARVHWTVRAKAVKKDRQIGFLCALEAKVHRISADRLSVLYTFHKPKGRRADKDGAISRLKAMQDGIADAVKIDDGKWETDYRWGDPVPGGAVKVELAPA